MEKVLLYAFKNNSVHVTIEGFFDDNGNLVIDGYDIGTVVEEYWGDSDYEYSTTINPEEVDKLYQVCQIPHGSRMELLTFLQENFNNNHCYSQIQDMLDKHGIKYTGFSLS